MQITWQIVAQSYLDQLSAQERTRIQHAVRSAAEGWDSLDRQHIEIMRSDGDPVYVLRAGRDFRIFVSRKGDALEVLDIARWTQLSNYGPEYAGAAR
jgi:hypothetical protein